MLEIPAGWTLLPAGDATLTRRVKQRGPTWTIKEKRGRRVISLGVWAPAETIARERHRLEDERADPAHARRLEATRRRRARAEQVYGAEFHAAVRDFLAFAPAHAGLEDALARAIVAHAVPVGSGTVARTTRIPIERRAEAATIAWLRHQTTAYDHVKVPRVKGARRELRRMLAAQSRELLDRYRRGDAVHPDRCPLRAGLERRA